MHAPRLCIAISQQAEREQNHSSIARARRSGERQIAKDNQNKIFFPSFRRITWICPRCIARWLGSKIINAPTVGQKDSMGLGAGFDMSCKLRLRIHCTVVCRVLESWFNNSALDGKALESSFDDVSFVKRWLQPAGRSYFTFGATMPTNSASEPARCPICQAVWLAPGQGRASMSASEKSAR